MNAFEFYITTFLFIGFVGLITITTLALTAPDFVKDRED